MDNAHHREQNSAQDAAQNFAQDLAHAVSETHLLSLRKAWLQRLKAAHLSDPQMELNALWRTTTNDPLPLLACSTLTPSVARHITRLVERRAEHEPLARITKQREFASLTFSLNKACLIPRADSETLLEALLALTASPYRLRNIAELGCGSGCIVLALAANLATNLFRKAQRPVIKASDASAQALCAARKNARNLQKKLPVQFSRQNWSDKKYRKKHFRAKKSLDLLFANPPYIRRRERITLSREVARFDPPLALDGGFDGMRCFRYILRYAQQTLRCGGFLVLEHAPQQTRVLKTLAQQKQFRYLRTLPDLAGHDRVSVLRKHR